MARSNGLRKTSIRELKALLRSYAAPNSERIGFLSLSLLSSRSNAFSDTVLPSGLLQGVLPQGVLPQGVLVEISGTPGSGRTEAILQLIQENPRLRVAWIETEWTLYPHAFLEKGISPERVLLIEAGSRHPKGPLWVAHQILKSQVFNLLVLNLLQFSGAGLQGKEGGLLPERELRRLQLAAQKAGTSVILLNDQPSQRNHWPIAIQLHATRSTSFSGAPSSVQLEILKFKGHFKGMSL